MFCTINAGYEILAHELTSGLLERERGFCVGHNPNAPSPYVTWRFSKRPAEEGYDFFSGNYFLSYRKAMCDYHRRLADTYED